MLKSFNIVKDKSGRPGRIISAPADDKRATNDPGSCSSSLPAIRPAGRLVDPRNEVSAPGVHQSRPRDHRLQLGERDRAREVLHATVGRGHGRPRHGAAPAAAARPPWQGIDSSVCSAITPMIIVLSASPSRGASSTLDCAVSMENLIDRASRESSDRNEYAGGCSATNAG